MGVKCRLTRRNDTWHCNRVSLELSSLPGCSSGTPTKTRLAISFSSFSRLPELSHALSRQAVTMPQVSRGRLMQPWACTECESLFRAATAEFWSKGCSLWLGPGEGTADLGWSEAPQQGRLRPLVAVPPPRLGAQPFPHPKQESPARGPSNQRASQAFNLELDFHTGLITIPPESFIHCYFISFLNVWIIADFHFQHPTNMHHKFIYFMLH